jgi:hypothetical protein
LFSIQIQMTCWNVCGGVLDVPQGELGGAALILAVCTELATAEPAEFEALTATRIVAPTSAEVSV